MKAYMCIFMLMYMRTNTDTDTDTDTHAQTHCCTNYCFSEWRRGGGLGSSTIFKKFNEPYAPS